MVPSAHESEPGAELKQKTGEILHHPLLDFVLDSTLPRGDEVEDVRIFERLLRELAFGSGQRSLEIVHLARKHLPLVQLRFDLMDEHRAAPTVFYGCVHIPFAFGTGFRLVEKLRPGNCATAVAQFQIHFSSELRHVLQTANRKALQAREGSADILRQRLDEAVSPLRALVD